ncbi:MAG: hypothetical protein GY849_18955 [Deltaproteobacteria bacterium]|nr:hypothetical protein [Deltaproteobacteria bacterium]
MADSDCENLREQSGWGSRSDRKETSLSGVDGQKRNASDSGGERLEGFWERTRRIKKGLTWIGVLCDRSNEWDTISNWEVEPSVGGKSHGSSGRVDGGGSRDIESVDWEIEKASQKVLQYVRQDFVSKEIQRAIGGLDCIQAEETLLSVVREFEIGGRISRPVMEGKETPEELLRKMRYCEEVVSASLRPGQVEQFFRECPDAMRELSQLVASRSPTTWDSPLWESSTGRVTDVTENRVDRIKALGNGVVPAQVKKAFEVLMGLRVDDDLEML